MSKPMFRCAAFLFAHHGTTTKVGFNVCLMRWHQVDQALVALAFSAWISHAASIVRCDDDVNDKALNGSLSGSSLPVQTRGRGDRLVRRS